MRLLLTWRLAGCEVQTSAVGSQGAAAAFQELMRSLGNSSRHLVFVSVLADVGDTNGDGVAYVHGGRAALRLPEGSNPAMACAGMLPDPAVQAEVAVSVVSTMAELVGLSEALDAALPHCAEGPQNGTLH